MSAPQLYNPAEWSRSGRGRELQFFAADSDMYKWLNALPEQYAPYTIQGSRLTKHSDNKYRHVSFCYQLSEWGGEMGTPIGSSVLDEFFLHSAMLMPQLPLEDGVIERANDWAPLNGLTLIQHGAKRSGLQLESRIATVTKIQNRRTGKKVALQDRNAIFDVLHKMIKKELCFSSIQVFKDGHEEESSLQMMTADAAQLAAEGYFVRRPGRRLRR